jgi:hypothetical protein
VAISSRSYIDTVGVGATDTLSDFGLGSLVPVGILLQADLLEEMSDLSLKGGPLL